MSECAGCGAPRAPSNREDSLCRECTQTVRFTRPLPPRALEPPSWNWCQGCGGLRDVVRYGDVSLCAQCRGAA